MQAVLDITGLRAMLVRTIFDTNISAPEAPTTIRPALHRSTNAAGNFDELFPFLLISTHQYQLPSQRLQQLNLLARVCRSPGKEFTSA